MLISIVVLPLLKRSMWCIWLLDFLIVLYPLAKSDFIEEVVLLTFWRIFECFIHFAFCIISTYNFSFLLGYFFPQTMDQNLEEFIYSCKFGASLIAQTVKNLPVMWEICVQSLGWEDPLENCMATLSSLLAWRIRWTEEPGRPCFTFNPSPF